MKFSVIIPLYNKASYIEKALKSVLAQTYTDYEIIIVDDGSTDNGLEVVQQFNGSTIQQFNVITQQNSGVSIARNNGVKAAIGEYVAFLDADDWWKPTFLEEMNNLVEKYPSAGIYGSSYYKVKNGRNIPANIGVEKDFESGEIDYFKVYAKTMWMPLWTGAVVMPKHIFELENGFKSSLKLGEDFDLWVRIANKYPVVFLNKQLAYYNQDVEIQNRAVSSKFYTKEEHMLFSDYGDLLKNKDFLFLYEKLALYGLLPYYLNKVNRKETDEILNNINWEKHEKKYKWYYKRIPRLVLKLYFDLKRVGFRIKNRIR